MSSIVESSNNPREHYRLDFPLDRGVNLPAFEAPPIAEDVAWTLDASLLRELSLLSTSSSDPVPEINPEIGDLLCRNKKQKLHIPLEVLAYIEKKFPGLIPLAAFEETYKNEARIQEICAITSEEERNHALQNLSEQMHESTQNLAAGEKFIYFAQTDAKKGSLLTPWILENTLPPSIKALLDLNNIDNLGAELATQISSEVAASIKDFFPQSLSQVISKILTDGTSSFIPLSPSPLKSALVAFTDALERAINKRLMAQIHPSAREMLKELTQEILRDGIHNLVKKQIEDSLNNGLGKASELIEDAFEGIESILPKAASPILSAMGIKVSAPSSWIEIEKQNNGTYTLCIYASTLSAQFHPQLIRNGQNCFQTPLTFSNLSIDQLSIDFFHRLITFKVWPKIINDISYSAEHLYTYIRTALDTAPEAPQSFELVTEDSLTSFQGNYGLLLLYLKTRKKEENPNKFLTSVFEKIQFQALLDLWSHVKTELSKLSHDRPLRLSLLSMASNIEKEAFSLFKAGSIEEIAFKKIYATTWEIKQTIHEVVPEQALQQPPMPSLIKDQIFYFLDGLKATTHHLAFIRDGLVNVFGEPMEEVIDSVLDEYRSNLESRNLPSSDIRPAQAADTEWDILTVFSYGAKTFSYLWMMVNIIRYGCNTLLSSLILQALHSALTLCFPGSFVISLLAPGIIRNLVTFFGTVAVERLLPRKIRDFYESKKAELVHFVGMHSIRILGKWMLSKETIEATNAYIKMYQQRVIKKGEISYLLKGQIPIDSEQIPLLEEPKAEAEEELALDPLELFVENNSVSDLLEIHRNNLARPIDEHSIPDQLYRYKTHVLSCKLAGTASTLTALLHEFIALLPLPTPNEECMWDRIPENQRLALMEDFAHLALFLSGHSSQHNILVSSTSVYTIYAITDRIARHIRECHLTDAYPPNGWALVAQLKKHPYIQASTSSEVKRFNDLLVCFGIDPNKEYTNEEIECEQGRCLFNWSCQSEISTNRFQSFLKSNFTKGGDEIGFWNSLLEDPVIQEKLTVFNIKHDSAYAAKLLTLISDPTLSQLERSGTTLSPETIQLFSQGNQDRRRSLLPRPLYLLRLIFTRAKSCAYKYYYTLQSINNFSPEYHAAEPTWLLHKLTKDLFRCYSMNMTICNDRPLNTSDLYFQASNNFCQNSTADFQDIFQAPLPMDMREPLTEEEIIMHPPAINDVFCERERILLHMITTQPDNQVIRLLSYFQGEHLDRLSEPRFRYLFEAFLLRIGFIDKQLEDRPQIVKALGNFFHVSLNHFDTPEHRNIFQDLVRIGIVARALCLHDVPEKDASSVYPHFPNFAELIITKIIPFIVPESKEETKNCKLLLLCYADLAPACYLEFLEKDLILQHVSFSLIRMSHDDLANTAPIAQKWLSFIQSAFEADFTLRSKTLDTLFNMLDRTISLEPHIWEGSFPVYSSGTHLINLNKLLFQRVYANVLDALAAELRFLLQLKKITLVQVSETTYKSIEGDLVVEQTQSGTRFYNYYLLRQRYKIYTSINNVRYRLLLPTQCKFSNYNQESLLTPIKCLLLQESDQNLNEQRRSLLIVHQDNQQTQVQAYVNTDQNGQVLLDIHWNEKRIDQEILQEVLLDETTHGLTLISSWFSSNIKAYRSLNSPDRIKRIEVEGLVFNIEEHDGSLKAFCQNEEHKNFYIADQTSSICSTYPKSLLLENEWKEQKLILIPASKEALFFSFITKCAKMPALPAVASRIISDFFAEQVEDYSLNVYALNASGKLESSNAEELVYLVSFHIANKNWKEARYYFSSLKQLSNLQPMSKELCNRAFLPIVILLMLEGSEDAVNMQLHIDLLFMRSLLENSTEKQAFNQQDVLLWAASQLAYNRYLSQINEGRALQFTESQEILLLRGIQKKSSDMLKALFKTIEIPNNIQKLLKQFGLKSVAQWFLMAPLIAKRAESLKIKHDLMLGKSETLNDKIIRFVMLQSDQKRAPETSFTSSATNAITSSIGTLNPMAIASRASSSLVNTVAPASSSALTVHKIISCIANYFQTGTLSRCLAEDLALIVKKNIALIQCAGDSGDTERSAKIASGSDFDSIPLSPHQMRPGDLLCHFLTYYRLATRELPDNLSTSEKEHFYAMVDAFKNLLTSLRGQPTSSHTILVEFFLTIIDLNKHEISKATVLKVRESILNEKRNLRSFSFTDFLSDVLERAIKIDSSNRFNNLILTAGKTIAPGILKAIGKNILTTATGPVVGILSSASSIYLKGTSKIMTGASLLSNGSTIYKAGKFVASCVSSLFQDQMDAGQQSYVSQRSVERLLPPELAQELTDSDANFDGHFEKLVNGFFIRESEARRETKHIALSTDDSPSIQRHISRFNQNCIEFDERGRSYVHYKLKDEQSLTQLRESLTELAAALKSSLSERKQHILESLRQHKAAAQENSRNVSEIIAGVHYETEEISFRTLRNLFVKGDRKLIQHQFSITEEEAICLENVVYYYFLYATRLHQVERSLEHIHKIATLPHTDPYYEASKAAFTESLCLELLRTRSYKWGEHSCIIERSLITFEYTNRMLLWEAQTRQSVQSFGMLHPRKVAEVIPGSGKTVYMVPATNNVVARHEGLIPINIWPEAIAGMNTRETAAQGYRTFSQDAYSFSFSGPNPFNKKKLFSLLISLKSALEGHSQIHLTKEKAQFLLGSFISKVFSVLDGAQKFPKMDKKALFLFMKTLGLLRTHGKAIIDEAHEAYNQITQFQMPMGKNLKLKKTWISYTELIFKFLLQLENDGCVNITKTQEPIHERVYYDVISPYLAKQCSLIKELGIPEDEQDNFALYLLGRLGYVPEYVTNHPLIQEIALMKGYITVILKNILLKERARVDFGVSKKSGEEFAIPYIANECPKEGSTIQNPFEATAKTYLTVLYSKLDKTQAGILISHLQKLAQTESRKYLIPHAQTQAGLLFSTSNLTCDLCSLDANNLMPDSIAAINSSPHLILTYVSTFIAPKISYYQHDIRISVHDFDAMFKESFALTGTPYNFETFPRGSQMLWDPGTNGEIKHTLQEKPSSLGFLTLLDATSGEDTLTEILNRFFPRGSLASAIIDCGALLRGIGKETSTPRLCVAKCILAHQRDHMTNTTGVAFYSDDDNQLVVLRELHAQPEELKKTEPGLITYFDHAHTFAANVPQPIFGEGIVTISEDAGKISTSAMQIGQGVFRMRGRSKHQKTLFVARKSYTFSYISTLETLYRQSLIHEARDLENQHYFADTQKVLSVIKSAVLDKMIFASSIESMLKIAQEFKTVLVSSTSDNLFSLFGLQDTFIPAAEALENFKEHAFQPIAQSDLFDPEEKDVIRNALREIIPSDIYPSEIHTYIGPDGYTQGALNTIGQMMHVMEQQNVEQTSDQQQTVEQTLFRNFVSENIQEFLPAPNNWNERLRCDSLEWLEFNANMPSSLKRWTVSMLNENLLRDAGVILHRMQDVLSLSDDANINALASTFEHTLWCSDNFMPVNSIKVGSRLHKPLLEVLVTFNADHADSFQIGALDNTDVAFWKRKLKEDRSQEGETSCCIGIYNVGTSSLIATGRNSFNEDDLLQSRSFVQGIVILKFLHGMTHYPISHHPNSENKVLKEWLRTQDLFLMKSSFQYIHQRYGTSPYDGSIIERIFLELEIEDSRLT